MKTVLNHYGIVAGAIFHSGKLYMAGTHHCDAVSIGVAIFTIRLIRT